MLVVVMGSMLLLTFLSQPVSKEGLPAEDGFKLGDVILKYPGIASFLGDDQSMGNKKADSVIHLIGKGVPDEDVAPAIPDFSKIDTSRIERIRYPDASGSFARAIKEKLSSGKCRILHYGDSQIEGDRISGFLRNRLQGQFGGSGPGFIPVRQPYSQVAAEIVVSENWNLLAAFDPKQEFKSDRNYGIYGSVSRFAPQNLVELDTLNKSEPITSSAWITIRPSTRSYGALKRYNRIGLHYGNAIHPVKVTVKSGEEIVSESSLINDKAYHCFEINTENTPAELTIELESIASPDFYGITLDGNAGISLDNVAMRGASGTVFSKLDPQGFQSMAANLEPKIILFQYGGNTVPYIKDSTAINDYARYLAGNLRWLQRQIPGVHIIVIGPTDKSTMINGSMVTYPLLPYLDKKLSETVVAQGWAYWSMYKAMGGMNAMPQWVDQGLAANDYTHFSPKGTRIISELFFTSLYLDLRK